MPPLGAWQVRIDAPAYMRRAPQQLGDVQNVAAISGSTVQVLGTGPVPAQVIERLVGERVVGTNQFAGTEIMRIADLSKMEVRVKVNENDIINVKLGDHAVVSIDAFPGRQFNGKVYEISSSALSAGGAGNNDAGHANNSP